MCVCVCVYVLPFDDQNRKRRVGPPLLYTLLRASASTAPVGFPHLLCACLSPFHIPSICVYTHAYTQLLHEEILHSSPCAQLHLCGAARWRRACKPEMFSITRPLYSTSLPPPPSQHSRPSCSLVRTPELLLRAPRSGCSLFVRAYVFSCIGASARTSATAESLALFDPTSATFTRHPLQLRCPAHTCLGLSIALATPPPPIWGAPPPALCSPIPPVLSGAHVCSIILCSSSCCLSGVCMCACMCPSRVTVSMGATASPPTDSSPTVPTPVAPPSIDEALSYWIRLSRLIHRVCVTLDSTPSADECTSYDRLQGCIGNAEDKAPTFTRYTLHRVLLCCGIKQHRVRQTTDRMLAQLLSAAYTTASALTVPVVLLDSTSLAPTSFRSPVRRLPVPLPVLVADWLKQSSRDDQNASQHKCYCLQVPAVTWNRSIVKCLGGELRGQMISLRPLSRWRMVCEQQLGRMPVVIFIGGTSGAGKSTLASLVASQLRVPNVLSTDTVRQVLRTRLRGHEAQFPALFVSTYEAHRVTAHDGHVSANDEAVVPREQSADENAIVQGYEAQCEPVLRVLDGMLARLLARRESIVVEGVHLLPQYLAAKRAELLMSRVVCVTVLVRIPKTDSHLERLCIRARGMSMRAHNNRYIASFKAIRAIQAHLVDSVEAASLPVLVLSNTNVDKSFTALHYTLLETMEYAAVHGWPADAAAAAEIPLPGLVLTAVKNRLVAVMRQRRYRRSATDDTSRSSGMDTSALGEDEKGSGAKGPFGAPVLASHARLSAHSPAGSSSSGAAPRARSAELLGVVQRCLLEQGLRYHARTSNAQTDVETVCGSSDALGLRDASSLSHAHVVVRRSSTTASKSNISLTASSHLPPDSHSEEFDDVEMPSLIGS
ncbi:hypothetical protein, conserved [Leishmania tarentolae]|uniref:Zeta toxin domain-containing protein n=1 Tax=Leishmania tarentolae TaxID=5689 RepID=A0A640KFN9_LEITA|nr:hypothetical protein, conserved [Leishmania tarentolae]